jgi:HIT domain
MPEEFILEKSDFFYVTLARAPYINDHLLIIPKRHVVLFNDLSWEEVQDLMQLISKWNEKLHQKHCDVNLLLRDGFM